MRRVAVALVLAVGPALAAADTVAGLHRGALELEPAAVEVELADHEARITVRAAVHNPEAIADEAEVELALPEGAVVTAMRFRPRRSGPWLEGRLLAAADGAARWADFLEAPYAGPRGPALLELAAGVPILRLLLVPGGGRVPFEYRYVTPVCRVGGRWLAPVTVADAATTAVRGPRGAGQVLAADAVARILGTSVEDACARTEPAAAWTSPSFAVVTAPPLAGVRGQLVSVPAGSGRVVELTIDTGDRLAPPPRGASVVFVVDASRSMGADGIAAQLAMVRAYLARAPGARFEVVVYRRFATRLFAGWQAGADAARALAAAPAGGLVPGNGSHLDAGLALAAELLAVAPGPRRLVLFTDDRVREALDADAVTAALTRLPADAIAHAVTTDGGGGGGGASTIERLPDHWLAPVVGRWGGIAASATVGGAAEPEATRAAVFEELVRPRRLEGVTVLRGDGGSVELGDLVEGESLRWMALHPDDAVTVTAMIWARPWQPALVTAVAARRRVAAQAFADPALVAPLAEGARRALAGLGHVVSDVTSLWADDPRWIPGGLPAEVGLIGRCGPCGTPNGVIGIGRIGTTSGHGRLGPVRERPDPGAVLAAPVAACARRHGATAWRVALEVETTGREVVDVALGAVTSDAPAAAAAALGACVVEAGWALDLDERYAAWTERFAVEVSGARP